MSQGPLYSLASKIGAEVGLRFRILVSWGLGVQVRV